MKMRFWIIFKKEEMGPLMKSKKFFNHYNSIGWKWAKNTDTGLGILTGKNWMFKRRRIQKEKNGADRPKNGQLKNH